MAGHVTDLTQLLAELVQINSTNPDLVTDGAGERDTAHYIAAWADRHGLEAHLVEPVAGLCQLHSATPTEALHCLEPDLDVNPADDQGFEGVARVDDIAPSGKRDRAASSSRWVMSCGSRYGRR
jgi:hypothetical protein